MADDLCGGSVVRAVQNVGDGCRWQTDDGTREHAEEDAEGDSGNCRSGKGPEDEYEEGRNDL